MNSKPFPIPSLGITDGCSLSGKWTHSCYYIEWVLSESYKILTHPSIDYIVIATEDYSA